MSLIIGLVYGLLVGIGIVASLVFVANKPDPKPPSIVSELDIEHDSFKRMVRWTSFAVVVIIFCMLIGSCLASASG